MADRGIHFKPPTESEIDFSRSGTTFGQRMMLKAFAANPEQAAEYLRSLGKNAVAVHDGLKMQVAIQAPDGKWGVLDPKQTEWADLAELIPDVVQAAGVDLGTVGGMVGGALTGAAVGAPAGGLPALPGAMIGGAVGTLAGGAAAGGGMEALRQAIGKHYGINNEYDIEQILGQAVAGGAAPLLGPLIGKGAKGIGKLVFSALAKGDELTGSLAKQLLTRLASLKTPENLSFAMARRELDNPANVQPSGQVLLHLRDALQTASDWTGANPAGPVQSAKRILTGQSKYVPAKPVIQAIYNQMQKTAEKTAGPEKDAAVRQGVGLLKDLFEKAGIKQPSQVATAVLPTDAAFDLKVAYQHAANYSERAADDPVNAIYKAAGGAMKRSIEDSIKQPSTKARYIGLMNDASQRFETINNIVQRVKGEATTSAAPESFIRSLNAPGKSEARTFVEQFQKQFPQFGNILDKAKLAGISELLQGDKTAFSATGNILGPALGAGMGMKVAGPVGAVAGGALGTAAAFRPVQTGRFLGAMNAPFEALFNAGAKVSPDLGPAAMGTASALTQGLGQSTVKARSNEATPGLPPMSFNIDELTNRPDLQEIMNEVNAMPGDEAAKMSALGAALMEPPPLRSARRKLEVGAPSATFTPDEIAALKKAGVSDAVLKQLQMPQPPAQKAATQ